MSGNEFWSSYDFWLPELVDLPGPRGAATFGVTEFFERSKDPSNLFTRVVWTEPYPLSEANAARFEATLADVHRHVLESCGGKPAWPSTCERTYNHRLSSFTRPCKVAGGPNQSHALGAHKDARLQ